MDYRKLSNDITELVAESLHYFDYVERNRPPETLDEVEEAISGVVARYRNDPAFHAKVEMLTSQIMKRVKYEVAYHHD